MKVLQMLIHATIDYKKSRGLDAFLVLNLIESQEAALYFHIKLFSQENEIACVSCCPKCGKSGKFHMTEFLEQIKFLKYIYW